MYAKEARSTFVTEVGVELQRVCLRRAAAYRARAERVRDCRDALDEDTRDVSAARRMFDALTSPLPDPSAAPAEEEPKP